MIVYGSDELAELRERVETLERMAQAQAVEVDLLRKQVRALVEGMSLLAAKCRQSGGRR